MHNRHIGGLGAGLQYAHLSNLKLTLKLHILVWYWNGLLKE